MTGETFPYSSALCSVHDNNPQHQLHGNSVITVWVKSVCASYCYDFLELDESSAAVGFRQGGNAMSLCLAPL